MKPKTKAAKATTKASAKAPNLRIEIKGIPFDSARRDWLFFLDGVLEHLTREQLVAELKRRKIGVPKFKDEMQHRLAHWIAENPQPVSVTIGR